MATDKAKIQAALDVRFDSGAGWDLSVRQYLCKLLLTLSREQGGFRGGLIAPLIEAGFIAGTVERDVDDYVDEYRCDAAIADAFLEDLITEAFGLSAEDE